MSSVIRELTVTYRLPEELWLALEEKAVREGRRMEDVVAEHELQQRPPRPPISAEEAQRRHEALVALFGTGDSGDPHSSDNERIDVDLAREYEGKS
jgi:hypothetical protein